MDIARALPAPSLLERILDTPQLAHVIPRLQPDVLHKVIQRCGLEDCGEIVALATPAQLARVFDLDLWRSRQPGLDEQFDADRFGVWLEVLMELGAGVAARTVANMDADLVIAALAQHLLVYDHAALAPATPRHGEDVGGYRVVATRTDSWDAIVGLLTALHAAHPGYFHRVMAGCRHLSNDGFELDGLHELLSDRDQVMFDLAADRERRREQQGYVTPAQAGAFLTMSRQPQPKPEATTSRNPIARAYFRDLDWTTASADESPAPAGSEEAIAAVVDVLLDAGVLTPPPRALLDGPQGHMPRVARIQARLQAARDRNHDAYAMRGQELAYLANTILAGCSIQARPFTVQEASDAAVAVCNLGLENWPLDTAMPDDFLVDHDLISVFQTGWALLHNDVCMPVAQRLIDVLAGLRHADREIQAGLHALRLDLTKQTRAGTPWRARESLDVIMILDMPAWAALLGLMAECPVLHAGIDVLRGSSARTVSASAFEFIAENSQVARVRAFMQSLSNTLRG